MLAKDVRAPRTSRRPPSSLTSIASNRASTGCSYKGFVVFLRRLEEAQRIDVVAHQQVFGLLIVIKHHL
ncbi:hypothetical protein ABFV59_18000, partial [Pseudomonas silesiensis]